MNRYSFTGKGKVLIKTVAAGRYGADIFEANEPIAYFTDILIDVVFNNTDKIARQGSANLLGDSKSEASIIRVSNIKTSESLQSLLYKKQNNKTKNKTIIKSLVSSGGILVLPLESDQVLTGDMFIYNQNQVKQTGYTVDTVNHLVNGLTNGTYIIFYSVNSTSNSTYSLETPTMSNMSLEIVVDGNLNSMTGELVMHLNKVQLLSRPTLDFNSNTPFADTLEFLILKNDEGVEVNYYG